MAQEILDKSGNPVLDPFFGTNEKVFASYFRSGVKIEKKVDMKDRTLTIVGTDETKDREGDIIRVKGWDIKDFLNNPVMLWAHNYSSVPIAAARRLIKKRNPTRMVFEEKFPPEGLFEFADLILALYNIKQINASSVGFIPKKWEKLEKEPDDEGWGDPREFLIQILLELSGCPVPCNPTALQESLGGMKSLKKLIDIPPEDIAKYLIGDVSVPDPERKEEIEGEYAETKLEVIDETLDASIVVPEEVEEIFHTVASDEEVGKEVVPIKRRSKKKEFKVEVEEKEKFSCECIACGHLEESEKHCKDIVCSECGGKMRREERPGPGQESIENEEVKDVEGSKLTGVVEEEIETEELTKGVLVYKTPKPMGGKEREHLIARIKEAFGKDVKLLIIPIGSELQWVKEVTVEDVVKELKTVIPEREKTVYDSILDPKSSGHNDLGTSVVGEELKPQKSNLVNEASLEQLREEIKNLGKAVRRLNDEAVYKE